MVGRFVVSLSVAALLFGASTAHAAPKAKPKPVAAKSKVAAAPKPKKEAPAFHDETIPLPKRMEMAKDGNLALKLYAAMAQTDCTACGYDCEGYAAAIAAGTEKDPNLCVPGTEETARVVKDLLKGTGLPAAAG